MADGLEGRLKTIRCTLEPAGFYRGKKRYTIEGLPEIKATVHPWLEVARWYLLRGEDPETRITFGLKGERKTTFGAFVEAAQEEARERLGKEWAERNFPDAAARAAYFKREWSKLTTMSLRVKMPEAIGSTTLGGASCLWVTDDLKHFPAVGKASAWEIRMGRQTRSLLRAARKQAAP